MGGKQTLETKQEERNLWVVLNRNEQDSYFTVVSSWAFSAFHTPVF